MQSSVLIIFFRVYLHCGIFASLYKLPQHFLNEQIDQTLIVCLDLCRKNKSSLYFFQFLFISWFILDTHHLQTDPTRELASSLSHKATQSVCRCIYGTFSNDESRKRSQGSNVFHLISVKMHSWAL